jgi:hypothetical protein
LAGFKAANDTINKGIDKNRKHEWETMNMVIISARSDLEIEKHAG